MRFRILGPLEVLSPDGWTSVSAAKWRSLLACLLVRTGQLVSTDSLIDELWGGNPPAKANNLVSIYVHRLRRLIGDANGRQLVHRAPGYLLRVSPGDLDLHEFQSLVADGTAALADGDPRRAAAMLASALELWRGPLLADVPQTPRIAREAQEVDELRLAAAELRIEAELGCGRAAHVIAELRRLVRENPLREGLWLLLMRALDDAGRHAEALEAYARAREAIAGELGVDPGAELQRLHQRLLAADASAAGPPPARAAGAASTGTAAPDRPPGAARRPGEQAARPGEDPSATRGAPGRPGAAAAACDAAGTAAAKPDAGSRETAADRAGWPGRPAGSGELPGKIAAGTYADAEAAAWLAAAGETAAGADHGMEPATAGTSGTSGAPGTPAQLPADIGDFTGREAHVAHLCQMLADEEPDGSPGAVRIAVVNGAAGLGKTTLAVHAAHRVRSLFPDGQLYVDLLGASPQPATAGEVLARFLRDLGVAGDKVPARDDERAALYRTRLAGRRMLIVLDNAKDAPQVRPLLPGSACCAVLVTTRNRIPDLASDRFVDLNVLEDTEALTLFSRIVGDERSAAEPDATAEVLVACAGLPLAIRICAARLAARRQWRIATLANRLRNEQRRLDELRIGDLAVRSSFQVSYDSLGRNGHGAGPARVFRLLGLWQGPSISLPTAAALIGEPEDDIADALESLVDANLLESPAPDWYRFHDLLRVYATERAQAEEPEAVRVEAVGRVLRWYLETAEAAAGIVSPNRYRIPRGPVTAGPPPPAFGAVEDALAWYDEERVNVVAATRQAAAAGLHDVAWRLPPTLFPVFNRRNNWADCVTAHRTALESARKTGDERGEAWVLDRLGWALARLRDSESFRHLERALAIRRELGDTAGEALTAISLAEGHLNLHGPGEDALRFLQHAVGLLRPAGVSALLAVALNNLGEVYLGMGEVAAAEQCFAEVCDISQEIGGHTGAHAIHNLGLVYLSLGRLDDAIAKFTEALPRHRASGLLIGEAETLKHLGEAHAKTGSMTQARASLTSAMAIFEQIGDQRQAAETASLLASLSTG